MKSATVEDRPTFRDVPAIAKALDETANNTAISLFNGTAFDVLDPSTWTAEVFDINQIARALGNTCRYAGHIDFMSVAEHSVNVSRLAESQGDGYATQMLCLLHDATEAFLGDVPSPIKRLTSIDGRAFKDVEDEIQAVLLSFHGFADGYTEDDEKLIKHYDWESYLKERARRPHPSEYGQIESPSFDRELFIRRYNRLKGFMQQEGSWS